MFIFNLKSCLASPMNLVWSVETNSPKCLRKLRLCIKSNWIRLWFPARGLITLIHTLLPTIYVTSQGKALTKLSKAGCKRTEDNFSATQYLRDTDKCALVSSASILCFLLVIHVPTLRHLTFSFCSICLWQNILWHLSWFDTLTTGKEYTSSPLSHQCFEINAFKKSHLKKKKKVKRAITEGERFESVCKSSALNVREQIARGHSWKERHSSRCT